MRLQNFSDGRKPYFPVFIDLSEKKIVVIGGGRIALRRVNTLLLFANDITVIAPEIMGEIHQMADMGKVRWIPASYVVSDSMFLGEKDEDGKKADEAFSGADMVLALTDDGKCNETIAGLCKSKGIPVNVSHKKEMCDFYFPAVVMNENIVAGITSSGLNHSQAREMRERVEKALFTQSDDSKQTCAPQ